MEEDTSSLIGDSFDSHKSSSAPTSDEEEFTLGNDSEACDFLQAMNVAQAKSESTNVASVTDNTEVLDVFEFHDEDFETTAFSISENSKSR